MNIFHPEVVKQYLAVRGRGRRNDRAHYLKHQQKALTRLLDQARKHVPFQAARIGANLDLSQVPPVGKSDMMQSLAETFNRDILASMAIDPDGLAEFMQNHDGQTSPWYQGEIKLSRTTGTTGRPGKFCRTKVESWKSRATSYARVHYSKNPLLDLLPKKHPKRFVILGSAEGSTLYGINTRSQMLKDNFAKQFELRFFPLDLFDQDMADALDEYQPFSISAYPLHLVRLAQIRLAGIGPKWSPARISSGADLLERHQYETLRRAFPKADIVNHYGTIECGMIAQSCHLGHLHLNEDLAVVEPVDANDQPVPPGTWSDATLVTCLQRELQPIIRYRLADSIRILEEPCECGSAQPVLEIRGRRFAPLYIDDNHGKELTVTSETIMDPIIDDFTLPWSHLEYHQRNQFDYYFHIPTYPTSTVLTQSADIANRASIYLDEFKRKYNCDRSVSFRIHTVSEEAVLREGSKRKEVRTSVLSRLASQ